MTLKSRLRAKLGDDAAGLLPFVTEGLKYINEKADLPASEIYVTTNAGGRAESAVVQVIVSLVENDYIEIFVENDTAATDITVTEMNVIVEALS